MNPRRPGPTGDFPDGKLNPQDEGGLAIKFTTRGGKVIVEFGTPIAWLGVDPSQAESIAAALMQGAQRARRQLA